MTTRRVHFLAYMIPAFCMFSACKETTNTRPFDVTVEISSNSGGSRSYLSTVGSKSDLGTMESSGRTFADFKIKYQYIIVSSTNEDIEMLVDLKLIQKDLPDQLWKSTLKIPSVSTVSFKPFKDVSVRIAAIESASGSAPNH
jgi:hypothetical protein